MGISLPFGGEGSLYSSPRYYCVIRSHQAAKCDRLPATLRERRAGPIARVPIVSRLAYRVNIAAAALGQFPVARLPHPAYPTRIGVEADRAPYALCRSSGPSLFTCNTSWKRTP
jgi:hypothetical protein